MKDHYKTLGVSIEADKSTIKKAYRKLAQLYHPDKNQDNESASEKFKEISEAYSVLSNKDMKAEYDFMKNSAGTPFNLGIEEMFSSMFGFESSTFQKSETKDSQNKEKMVNFKIPLSELSKEEIINKSFKVKKSIRCKDCNGKGGDIVNRCHNCDGLGKKYDSVRKGNSFFQNITICNVCLGRCNLISGLCKSCKGQGSIILVENYNVTIDCKKA